MLRRGCCHHRWLCPFCHWNLMIHHSVGVSYINICLVIPSWIHLAPRQCNSLRSIFYITPFHFIASLVNDALRFAFSNKSPHPGGFAVIKTRFHDYDFGLYTAFICIFYICSLILAPYER